jgi:hypothetical protein
MIIYKIVINNLFFLLLGIKFSIFVIVIKNSQYKIDYFFFSRINLFLTYLNNDLKSALIERFNLFLKKFNFFYLKLYSFLFFQVILMCWYRK